MLLSSIVIAGGALFAGASVKAYQENKRKKKSLGTICAERMVKNELFIYRRKGIGKKRGSPKVAGAKSALQKFKEERITPLFSGPTHQGNEISAKEKEINHYLTCSGVSLALAVAGGWYPVLNVVYVPVFFYIIRPFAVRAYQGIVKEKKVGVAVLEILGTAGPFLLGYFFVASLTNFLINLSNKLIIKTEDHSRGSLINIFGEQPRSVWIEKEGVEVEIPFETLSVGDIVVVQAGQTICADGIVTKGVASIDERTLTGESQPVEKSLGEPVFASTMVLAGRICIQVEKAGRDTVAAQIGDILNSTADFKSSVVSRGQKIVELGATPTLVLSALSLPFLGLESALAILYASFGYHMKYVAPISVLNFLRITSENGVLIKDGRSLELLSQIDTVVFDKTGTLTEEVPTIGAIHTCNEYSEKEVVTYAAAAEDKQTHPIALAIINFAKKRELTLPPITDATVKVGYGLKVKVSGKQVRIGSGRFMEMCNIVLQPDIKKIEENCHDEGYSLVYVAIDNRLAGAIELHPTIRPEAKEIIHELRKRRVAMYIISGDHQKPTRRLAELLNIDHYFAEVLPQDKASLIEQLQQEGKSVCFIGDGINDSIALKKANVGISLRGASTAATDSAGIILMDGTLNQLISVLNIANDLDANLTRSAIMTVAPGVICVGGVLFLHFSIASSIILFNMGLAVSILNAMLPLVKHHWKKQSQSRLNPKKHSRKITLHRHQHLKPRPDG